MATVVAVVAYAGSDMVHEVLGHGLACALSPTVRALSLSTVALQVIALVQRGLIAREEPSCLLFPAYITGGLLLVLGSALNPISPRLILTTGVSSGFGAMAGLAFIPGSVEKRTALTTSAAAPLPYSLGWFVAGVLVALIFIGWLGPGVRLS